MKKQQGQYGPDGQSAHVNNLLRLALTKHSVVLWFQGEPQLSVIADKLNPTDGTRNAAEHKGRLDRPLC